MAPLLSHYNTLKGSLYKFTETIKESGKQIIFNDWGGGFAALKSYVNHSCYPNAEFSRRERYHTLFTRRPIKKGEKVGSDEWSPPVLHFSPLSLLVRKITLSHCGYRSLPVVTRMLSSCYSLVALTNYHELTCVVTQEKHHSFVTHRPSVVVHYPTHFSYSVTKSHWHNG